MSDPHTHRSPDSAKGRLIILSAPSGAGKSTLCNAIIKRFPTLSYSVSTTTRPPRKGEKDGVDYYFISEAEFVQNIDNGKWAEWAKVHDHFYGTSADILNDYLQNGRCILLDIDVAGTKQILTRYPESITIFIMPPSMEALRQRLIQRGTDDPPTIEKRIKNAEDEIAQKGLYQYIIVNDKLSEAIDELSRIIEKHCFAV